MDIRRMYRNAHRAARIQGNNYAWSFDTIAIVASMTVPLRRSTVMGPPRPGAVRALHARLLEEHKPDLARGVRLGTVGENVWVRLP